jgi:translation initiation factor 1
MVQNQPHNQSQNHSRSKSGSGPAEQDPKGRRTVFSTDPEDDQGKGSPGAPVAAGANPAGPIATRQKNQPVIVGIERKGRGGKTVSVVAGVMSHDAGKQALLKLLKTKLGTGGTLKDDTIEIQGDHRDQIVEILTGLGYKAKKSGG